MSNDNNYSRPIDICATRLRWDRADLNNYFNSTYNYLQPIFAKLLEIENDSTMYNDVSLLDRVYYDIISAITICAGATVPVFKQNFFKFWWNQELVKRELSRVTQAMDSSWSP